VVAALLTDAVARFKISQGQLDINFFCCVFKKMTVIAGADVFLGL
jgi:hypothetical protein